MQEPRVVRESEQSKGELQQQAKKLMKPAESSNLSEQHLRKFPQTLGDMLNMKLEQQVQELQQQWDERENRIMQDYHWSRK